MKNFWRPFLVITIYSSLLTTLLDLYVNWLKNPRLFNVNFDIIGYHIFPYAFVLLAPWLPLIILYPKKINYWLAGMIIATTVNDVIWFIFTKNPIETIRREFLSNKIWLHWEIFIFKIPFTGYEMLFLTILRIVLAYLLIFKWDKILEIFRKVRSLL